MTEAGFYAPADWNDEELAAFACEIIPPGRGMGLDLGIVRAVKVLIDGGIETFESCQGGEGHALAEPAVRFHGDQEEGWRALSLCLRYGLPVAALRRYWRISRGGEPSGPHWEIVFREVLV